MPHLNGEIYSQKPPLLFWLINLSSLVTGGEVTEWSARLPSALAALATILLTFRIAERPFRTPAPGAWLAAAASPPASRSSGRGASGRSTCC